MKFKFLDRVVLKQDLPDHDLKAGDLGTVVETYAPDGVEVEFMTASGETVAVLTLKEEDVRVPGEGEMVSVRPLTSRV
jgi:hypothetical protein